jgi:hypothetical protein
MTTPIIEIQEILLPHSRMAKVAIVLREGIRFDRSIEGRSVAPSDTLVHCIA